MLPHYLSFLWGKVGSGPADSFWPEPVPEFEKNIHVLDQ